MDRSVIFLLTFVSVLISIYNIKMYNAQVVSVTTFDGGDNLDVIPESVVLQGTFRAFSNTSFYQLLRRIEEVYLHRTQH